jgi:catechol 2,3-dioxygenase-like lactoylglutathione lyase family enzyme
VFHSPQINFYVADVETSVAFYRDLLGFAETFRTPEQGEPMHVELELGELTLGVASTESLREIHGIATDTDGPPRAEIVLWTDDVDEAFATLVAKGARALTEPHDFVGTLRAAWVADPDGNPVQLVMRTDD